MELPICNVKSVFVVVWIVKRSGDHDWTRTNDPYHVKVVLYQLSYAITYFRVA